MTTKTLVSHVTYNDDTTEEFRGYTVINIENSAVVWLWATDVVIIPIHRIKKIFATEEVTE